MTPEQRFQGDFQYHSRLGNPIRCLELIAEYVETYPSRYAFQELGRQCCDILLSVPGPRRNAEILERLRRVALIDSVPEPAVAPSFQCTQAVVVLLIDERNPRFGTVRELCVELYREGAQGDTFPHEAEPGFRDALLAGCYKAQQLLRDAGIYLPTHLPEDYQFRIEPGPFAPNPPLTDSSVWLAAALSFFSFASGLQFPGPIAATGALDHRGTIGNLFGVDAKIQACMRERADVRKIFVLTAERLPDTFAFDPRIVRVENLEDAITSLWGAHWRTGPLQPPQLSLYDAFNKAMNIYDNEKRYEEVLARLTCVRDYLVRSKTEVRPDIMFKCEWRRASCLLGLGREREAGILLREWQERGRKLRDEGDNTVEDYVSFLIKPAEHLQDTFAFHEAETVLRDAISQAERLKVANLQLAKLYSALGQVLMFDRRFAEAEAEFLRAYARVPGDEKSRTCNYLGQLYTLQKRYGDALRFFAEGIERNGATVSRDLRRLNSIYNGVWKGRALYELQNFQEAIQCTEGVLKLSPPLYPGCLAWKWKGLAHLASGKTEQGVTALRECLDLRLLAQAQRSLLIQLIINTARLEWVRGVLAHGWPCPEGVTDHLRELLTVIEAFPEAYAYCAGEVQRISAYVYEDLRDESALCAALTALAAKVVY
jgi:tetratricopeptide (TPR) repeat protein